VKCCNYGPCILPELSDKHSSLENHCSYSKPRSPIVQIQLQIKVRMPQEFSNLRDMFQSLFPFPPCIFHPCHLLGLNNKTFYRSNWLIDVLVRAHLHWGIFLAKISAISHCDYATPTCYGQNERCDTNRIISVCVASPNVTKGSRGGTIAMQNCTGFHQKYLPM
jgi:hypothetical protein